MTKATGIAVKKKNAIAYLRQVCSSGLSREAAITEFLRSVSLVIPSNNNTFSVCGKALTDSQHRASSELGMLPRGNPGMARRFPTSECHERARNWFWHHPVIEHSRPPKPPFHEAEMVDRVQQPLDIQHVLFARVRLTDAQEGVLGLYRPKTQKPFDQRDQEMLLHLAPYLSHAFNTSTDTPAQEAPSGQVGMLVMDPQGQLLFQDAEASRLMRLATYPRLDSHMDSGRDVRDRLSTLRQNLISMRDVKSDAPPAITHESPHGNFIFRAFWLENGEHQENAAIGVMIEHRMPLTLQLLRGMRDLPLSPTQKQVAMLLAQGVSFEEIGRQLNVKPTTVKDHAGKIYMKLDIHRREQLLPALLEKGDGIAPGKFPLHH